MTISESRVAAFTEVAQHLHVQLVVEVYGESAVPALRQLLAAIQDLYKRIAPEIYSGTIVVVKTLADNALSLGTEPLELASLEFLPTLFSSAVVLQAFDNGTFRLWQLDDVNPLNLAQSAIVYSFCRGNEKFYANGKQNTLIKLVEGFSSNFAIPTFHSLIAALNQYKVLMARHSTCYILQTAWYDPHRIFLKSGPEEIMQKSLAQFLQSSLGTAADVLREQNTGASHPIDIKVEWYMTKRTALIEIKWLGKARTESRITQEYSASRAREGAKQLAGYLDKQKVQSPIRYLRGYLVVFDARRGHTKIDELTLDKTSGLKFEHKEIIYIPKYEESRRDFETPMRLFLEPVCID